MNRERTKSLELTTIAKAMIRAASIAQLVFTGIHVKALLLLDNEICGFTMFLFVLFGLMTMFETTRIRNDRMLEKLVTAVICAITAGFGVYLTSIYRYAIANQRALETAMVNRAVFFSLIIIATYLISGVFIVTDLVRYS